MCYSDYTVLLKLSDCYYYYYYLLYFVNLLGIEFFLNLIVTNPLKSKVSLICLPIWHGELINYSYLYCVILYGIGYTVYILFENIT